LILILHPPLATPPKMDWKVRKMHRLVAASHTCHKLDAFFELEQPAPGPLRQGAPAPMKIDPICRYVQDSLMPLYIFPSQCN
jgi:hypothetical protein